MPGPRRRKPGKRKARPPPSSAHSSRKNTTEGSGRSGAGTTDRKEAGNGDAKLLETAMLRTLSMPSEACVKKRHLHRENIFELPNLLTAKESAEIIKAAERHGFQLTELKATKWNAYRCNGRTQIISQGLAEALWKRCDRTFPELSRRIPVGLNPNFRLYRYQEQQAFGEHIDESVEVPAYGRGVRTLFTLLVYLNGGEKGVKLTPPLTGGATVFYKGTKAGTGKVALSFEPKVGSGLAHVHGERCMLHEGAPVERGTATTKNDSEFRLHINNVLNDRCKVSTSYRRLLQTN